MDAALCPRCDAPTPTGAAQCSSCAAPLEVAKPTVEPSPTSTPPGEFQPITPSSPSGSLADPNRPWAPPDASPHPTTKDYDQGPGTPRPRPKTRRPILLAGGGVLVLAAVLLGVFVTTGRSHERAPARPAAAARSTTTAGNSATAPDALRTPDTLGGLPRTPFPFPMPPIAGGRLVTESYSSPDEQQAVWLIAARGGVMEAPVETASFWAQNVIDGSPGTFRPYPRDGLEIRCADTKGLNEEVIGAVCYLDRPDLQVIVNGIGVPPARVPDLAAEAYHKLKA